MSCRGVYFALTENDSKHLLEAGNDEAVINVIQEEIEERWDKEWLQETDKAWDAIHRCLTDGTLRCRGKSTLEKFVLGGRQLHRGNEYIISYLTPNEVREVFQAAQNITKDFFRHQYFRLKRKFLWFDLTTYDGPIDETDFEYSWSNFEDARQLFQKAAAANRPVVFTVDQ